MKKHLARAGLVFLGILFASFLVEIGLRSVGWAMLRSRSREINTKIPPNAVRLLFIGESTTYGLFVHAEEAYPARVGKILEKDLNRPVAVFNRGVPGITSGAILDTLPAKLSTIHPDAVIFLLGTNDFHTSYNGFRTSGEDWLPSALVWRIHQLRIIRVLDLLLPNEDVGIQYASGPWLDERSPHGVTLNETETLFRQQTGRHLLYTDPEDKIAIAKATRGLTDHFVEMIRLCKNNHAAVIVIGYLSGYKENRILRNIADSSSVSFVATWDDQNQPPPDNLFTKDKFHPSVAGHNFMAEKIEPVVKMTLKKK